LPYHSAALGVSLPMGIGMFALALVDGVLMPNSSGAAETTDPLLNHEVLRQLGFGVFTDTVIAHGQGSPGRTAAAQAAGQFCLVRCFNMKLQAASASSNVLKGEPPILIAPRL
jgi:hypothetical protein